MNKESTNILSDIVVYTKYAKYIPEKKRRENWKEIIERYLGMLIQKYPSLEDTINVYASYLYEKKVLPSMRALQFAGPAIKKNESRLYNCSYLPIEDYRAFSEIMFLLLSGVGCGYSVQFHHISKLPEIQKPTKESKYLINDSIEGWSDAVKQLIKSYFGLIKHKPRFDYSDIRPKGTRLVTAGGKAPGPGPLKIALSKIEYMLDSKQNGDKLSSLEVHDICCYIADAVLAGGIRRAALISLFSFDDKEMLTCKYGNWYELNPQRGRANNSAVIVRGRVKEDEFTHLCEIIEENGTGEPGRYLTNDPDYGTNPCGEISLRPFTFCNLTEINGSNIENQEDFNKRARIAAFFGTLQASFTDFHYLRPIWKINSEKDALVGIGITGIASNTLLNVDLKKAAEIVLEENKIVAISIGINEAARTTTIKPSGTSSLVLGCSSGIHAWFADYYIRNIQCKVGDDLYNYFNTYHKPLIKIMDIDPHSAVIGIPIKAPDNATTVKNENTLNFLERISKFNSEWVQNGYRKGPNHNNVSATVYIKKGEAKRVSEWMWEHREEYNGLAVFPELSGNYKDVPHIQITREEYEERIKYFDDIEIDLVKIIEEEDNTTQKENLACSGGSCEL
ncbi:MAG: hypothetical protein ACRC0V_08490 [Fusobacteriaceae bacterium]